MSKGKLLISLFFILVFTELRAADEELRLVRVINDDFLVFNREINSYVPHLSTDNTYYNVVSFKILTGEILNHVLSIDTKNKITVFVNGKIYMDFEPGNNKLIDLQSIPEVKKQLNELFFSIYTEGNINNVRVSLVKKVPIRNKVVNTAKADNYNSVVDNYFSRIQILKDFKTRYLIGVFLSLLLFIFVKAVFPEILTNAFSFNPDSDLITERGSVKLSYYQNESIILLVISSLFIGIYLFVFADEINIFKKLHFLNHSSGWRIFLAGFGIAFLLFVLKVIINLAAAAIFGVSSFAKILSNEFAKTVFQVILFLYPLYFVILSPFNSINIEYTSQVIYPISLLIAVFVLKELYYFYELFNFKNFYIIAYICICDLFPTCILLKVLTQLEFV